MAQYSFRECVAADFMAMGETRPSLRRMIALLFVRPRWLAVFLFRCGSACAGRSSVFFKACKRLFWLMNYTLTGCDILLEAQIGPGFELPHPLGVVIGLAQLGRHVTVLQHVTIGVLDFASIGAGRDAVMADFPVIGDDVLIFAGAVVAGPIHVGDGAQIGANAVVIKDVPAAATAVGVPARIVPSAAVRQAVAQS